MRMQMRGLVLVHFFALDAMWQAGYAYSYVEEVGHVSSWCMQSQSLMLTVHDFLVVPFYSIPDEKASTPLLPF